MVFVSHNLGAVRHREPPGRGDVSRPRRRARSRRRRSSTARRIPTPRRCSPPCRNRVPGAPHAPPAGRRGALARSTARPAAISIRAVPAPAAAAIAESPNAGPRTARHMTVRCFFPLDEGKTSVFFFEKKEAKNLAMLSGEAPVTSTAARDDALRVADRIHRTKRPGKVRFKKEAHCFRLARLSRPRPEFWPTAHPGQAAAVLAHPRLCGRSGLPAGEK